MAGQAQPYSKLEGLMVQFEISPLPSGPEATWGKQHQIQAMKQTQAKKKGHLRHGDVSEEIQQKHASKPSAVSCNVEKMFSSADRAPGFILSLETQSLKCVGPQRPNWAFFPRLSPQLLQRPLPTRTRARERAA
ncbi:hypothetical protein AOLI_G00237250 [Acnodon oligacanthus]